MSTQTNKNKKVINLPTPKKAVRTAPTPTNKVIKLPACTTNNDYTPPTAA